MKERIKGAFTKRKILHFLKMALFVVALSLILLAYEVEDNKDIETITVANKNLKLKGYDTKSYWNSITNTGRFVVVLPDKYVQGLEVSENHLIIDTKEDTDAELENKITLIRCFKGACIMENFKYNYLQSNST